MNTLAKVILPIIAPCLAILAFISLIAYYQGKVTKLEVDIIVLNGKLEIERAVAEVKTDLNTKLEDRNEKATRDHQQTVDRLTKLYVEESRKPAEVIEAIKTVEAEVKIQTVEVPVPVKVPAVSPEQAPAPEIDVVWELYCSYSACGEGV